ASSSLVVPAILFFAQALAERAVQARSGPSAATSTSLAADSVLIGSASAASTPWLAPCARRAGKLVSIDSAVLRALRFSARAGRSVLRALRQCGPGRGRRRGARPQASAALGGRSQARRRLRRRRALPGQASQDRPS